MRSFKSEDRFYMKSRGIWVYTFNSDQLPEDIYDPDLLQGETVDIDGQEFVVKGVETFCIPRSKERPYRSNFGLGV